MAYTEQDCTIEHEGRKFTSGGAAYDDQRAVGYFGYRPPRASRPLEGHEAVINSWHGQFMGRARIVSSWPMPHSWISSRQYQVEATIDGVVYTGRTMGESLLWRGKRKANQG